MKLKITFALIFLFLSTLFIQAQDSLHTFLFKTSFVEFSFKHPSNFKVYSAMDEDIKNKTKLIASINTDEKTSNEPISLDLYLVEKSVRETVPVWGFTFKDNNWFNDRGIDLLTCSDFNFEGWQGVKVENNTWKELPWEFFLSKKIKDKEFIIIGSGLESKDFYTALKSISSFNFFVTLPTSNNNLTFNNIREVDFYSMEYIIVDDVDSRYSYPSKITVKDGKYLEEQSDGEKSGRIYYFQIYGLDFGDLTGDGKEDAVLISGENDGGTGWDENVYVFSLVNGKPKQIFLYYGGDRADNGIDKVEIKNGILYISQLEGYLTPCCADFVYTTGFKWNGQEFVQRTCEEFERASRVIKDTLINAELTKGVSVIDSVEFYESYQLELKKGQTLIADGTNFNLKQDVYLVLCDIKGKVLNNCRDIRTQKINYKVTSDGFYLLRISPEPNLECVRRFKVNLKVN